MGETWLISLVAVGLCYNNSESADCSLELNSYTFLPRNLLPQICSYDQDAERLQLFGLAPCNTVGDQNLLQLELISFIKINPILSSIVISLMILSVIGLVSIIFGLTWLIYFCYNKSRTPELPVFSGRIRGGTLLHPTRSWSPGLTRRDTRKTFALKMRTFGPSDLTVPTEPGDIYFFWFNLAFLMIISRYTLK